MKNTVTHATPRDNQKRVRDGDCHLIVTMSHPSHDPRPGRGAVPVWVGQPAGVPPAASSAVSSAAPSWSSMKAISKAVSRQAS